LAAVFVFEGKERINAEERRDTEGAEKREDKKVCEIGSEEPRYRKKNAIPGAPSSSFGMYRWIRSTGKSGCATELGVGDFAEDGGAAGAGGGREVGGAVMESFIGHEGEGEGFFGFDGNAEVRGRGDLDGI